MSLTKQAWLGFACLGAAIGGVQLTPAVALAEEGQEDLLHNITYRARVDGIARGAQITYRAQDDQMLTADPTMLPGRVFEANTVLPGSQQARMEVSVDWPYSANLHCEILVDGATAAQADDFIAPRLRRPKDDPNYGVLTCEVPVSPTGQGIPVTTDPADSTTTPLPDAPHATGATGAS